MTTELIAESAGWRARLHRAPAHTKVLLASLAVLLCAAAVAGGVFWHASASYDALHNAGWFGPQPGRPRHVVWARGDIGEKLIGPVGTTQDFEFALVNDGSHPLTIDGVEPAYRTDKIFDGPVVTAVSWATYREWPGGLVNGRPTRSEPFPAHLPAHGIVKIRFTVRKPSCPPTARGGYVGIGPAVRVHWDAMISSHTTVIDPGLDDYAIVLCGD
jgi:hypothetical protein